jgi:NADPH:quinone reductase-like Zn-dependent oxidoreductase
MSYVQMKASRVPSFRVSKVSMQTSTAGDNWELTEAGRRELKDLEGKWSKICVLGGSKGVGREIISLLSARGVNVVALVRKEESKAELEALPGVKSVIGDALEASDVISVLDGH